MGIFKVNGTPTSALKSAKKNSDAAFDREPCGQRLKLR